MENRANIFGTKSIPKINFSLAEVVDQAQDLVGRMSISGVQKKLSMRLDKKKNNLVVAPTGGEYILKPQLDQWPLVPQNEALSMQLAKLYEIPVPPFSLISLNDGSIAYIIKRFDREKNKKLAMEDFSQILGISSEHKYDGSYEQIAKGIQQYSAAPGLDKIVFFRILIFNFLICNSDAHYKNFSLINHGNGYRLSPAYDLLNTKVILPADREDVALAFNGKRSKLRPNDFFDFAQTLDLPPKVVEREFQRISETQETFCAMINNSEMPDWLKRKFRNLYIERVRRLQKNLI